MGKLHELLAVESDKRKTSERLVAESIKTFKKENLFTGTVKRTEMFDDDAVKVPDEVLKLETTVNENLDYSLTELVKYWDVVAQKDATNSGAKADVIIDGHVLLRNVPSTTLLGMEKKLNDLRNLFNSIPTLPPGIDWQIDNTHALQNVFKSTINTETFKTQKDTEYREMSPATEQHPAQMDKVGVIKTIGRFTTVRWSGMVTPHKKAKMITNLESVLTAFKKARQRANEQDTVDIKIGESIVDFILD